MKPRSIPLVDVEEDGLPFESAEQFKVVLRVGGEIECWIEGDHGLFAGRDDSDEITLYQGDDIRKFDGIENLLDTLILPSGKTLREGVTSVIAVGPPVWADKDGNLL